MLHILLVSPLVAIDMMSQSNQRPAQTIACVPPLDASAHPGHARSHDCLLRLTV